MLIRITDLFISLSLVLILLPIILVVLLIALIDTGSPIFSQRRLSKNRMEFSLYKFRSMSLGTRNLPTHEVNHRAITKFGSFIRKTKIDEFPQLFNVIFGDMSLVGPRPNLPSQKELIKVRLQNDVYSVKAGITGLSQIRGIDMSDPEKLAKSDARMIANFSIVSYFKYLLLTFIGKGQGDKVRTGP